MVAGDGRSGHVSARARVSRPPAEERDLGGQTEASKVCEKGEELKKRAATLRERLSHVIVSAEGIGKGRASRQAKARDNRFDRNDCWTFSVQSMVAHFQRRARRRRDPTCQPSRAKTGRIKSEGRKRTEREGVRWVHGCSRGCHRICISRYEVFITIGGPQAGERQCCRGAISSKNSTMFLLGVRQLCP